MDRIEELINYIKLQNNQNLTIEDLLIQIENIFSDYIQKENLTNKDISFLIEIIFQNINLTNDVIKLIFLNSKKKDKT